jgi:hypothetical protein
MSLRIPKGGLRMRLDPEEASIDPVKIEVALDVWEHWLEIAGKQLGEGETARDTLRDAVAEGDEHRKGEALEAELQAGMVATSAAAFSIDSFYASVKARLPAVPGLEASWRRNRTGRPAQIAETLKRGFQISHRGFADVRNGLEQVFKFRDWAVHAPAEFKEPVLHPLLRAGVEWRFIAFGLENCREIARFVKELITQLMERPKPEHAELVEWCDAYAGRPHES